MSETFQELAIFLFCELIIKISWDIPPNKKGKQENDLRYLKLWDTFP